MRYIYTILVVLTLSFCILAQSNKNETKSEYKEGRYFHTYSTCVVDAPVEEVEAVLDEIYDGLKREPTKNLRWAFLGLGKPKSEADNVRLYEKSVIYNPSTDVYAANLMMILDNSNVIEFNIEGSLKNVKHPSGKKDLTLTVTKKVKVLNDGYLSIASIPQNNGNAVLILHSKLKFGFIVDLFFTQSRYKEVIEWRLAGFLANIKKRAEENHKKKKQQASPGGE